MPCRFLTRLVGLLVLVTPLGCGLADYEQRMRESQRQAERFDLEVRLLNEAAIIPNRKIKDPTTKEDIELPMVDVFLPLPRGISGKSKVPLQKIPPVNGYMAVYPRKTAAKAAPPPVQPPAPPGLTASSSGNAPVNEFLEVSLCWSKDPDKKKFMACVLNLFPRKTEPAYHVLKLNPPFRPQLDVDTYEFLDQQDNYCSVSFRTWEIPKDAGAKEYLQVAVEFKVDKAKLEKEGGQIKVENGKQVKEKEQILLSKTARNTRDFCLEWWGIADEKGLVQREFSKRLTVNAPAAAPAQPPAVGGVAVPQ